MPPALLFALFNGAGRMGYNLAMPVSRMTCPSCGADLVYDSHEAMKGPDGKAICPYRGRGYPPLRAAHDRIYFGKWRKMDATATDFRRAYHQIGRHLKAIGAVLETKDLPAAKRDLGKAIEAFQQGDPDADSPDALRFLDHALSYAHTVIDDLLHEEGLPPHDPMEFSKWYNAVEVPFKEEW
ncbi:MAG: hypothetical protein JSV28_05835 [Deltaproteobacteria bacterium]|jgi:hypothetical protein|nr:MAG: hypothetical protein JSV28_05835 [Deltaproteobacteria bacterium]